MRHRLPPFVGALAVLFVSLVLCGCDSLDSKSGPKEADEHPVAFVVVDSTSGERLPGVQIFATFDAVAPEMVTLTEPKGYSALTTIRQDSEPQTAEVKARAVGLPLQFEPFAGTVAMERLAYPGTSTVARIGTIRLERAPMPAAGGGR